MSAIVFDPELDEFLAKSLAELSDEELEFHRSDSAKFVQLCENEQARRKPFHAHEREDQS